MIVDPVTPTRARLPVTAISFNTFEYVEDGAFALSECLRVLKPGRQFHVLLPLLYKVQGSPSDFNRRTAFWWKSTFAKRGISSAKVEIRPFAWGRLTNAFSFVEDPRLKMLRQFFLRLDIALRGTRGDIRDYPISYHISGTKPGA
jgi:SAM-dependent methyltransferase